MAARSNSSRGQANEGKREETKTDKEEVSFLKEGTPQGLGKGKRGGSKPIERLVEHQAVSAQALPRTLEQWR